MEYENNNTIEIHLPNNKSSLDFIKLSKENREKVIQLGLKFLNMGNSHIQLLNNKEWQQKIERLNNEKKENIDKIQQLLLNEKQKTRILIESQKNEVQSLISQTKNQLEQRYKSEIQLLETTILKNNNKISKKTDELNTIYKTLYGEFEEKILAKERHWEERLDKIKANYESKLQREKAIQENIIIKTQNSCVKGQVGEDFTFFELNKMFPKADIEDTRKQSGRGDFIFKENSFCMLIETKNYKNNVTKPEIDKFYRDIDTNQDIQCGIFMSLKSGICARDDFYLEIRDTKPIIFLHNAADNLQNIELAVQLFKLILKTDGIDLSNKEILDQIKNDIPVIKRNWNKMRNKIQKFEREMMESVISQESIFKNMFALLNVKY
jgi:hypothetical protein|tara:strand:+ start:928 stop:2067 length:1140 start_codon:yes stop_codon:yes gene_type:complete